MFLVNGVPQNNGKRFLLLSKVILSIGFGLLQEDNLNTIFICIYFPASLQHRRSHGKCRSSTELYSTHQDASSWPGKTRFFIISQLQYYVLKFSFFLFIVGEVIILSKKVQNRR